MYIANGGNNVGWCVSYGKMFNSENIARALEVSDCMCVSGNGNIIVI